jgi:glyoxylase-like metal-dependent hydrolase (beta-lactamase superfamily II)
MEYARSKDQPWVDLVAGMYPDGVMDLPFSFVLLQREGRNVLVDTGFMRDEHGPGFSGKFGIPTWMSPLRLLAEMKLGPDDISDIFITHAHFDHMGSIAEFPKAQICIQKSELLSWYELFALPKRFSHLTAIVDPQTMQTALGASIEHRVTLIDGDKDNVLPGIHVRLGGGHTRHLGRLHLFAKADHRPRQRRRVHSAQQRRWQRLGAVENHRQDERRAWR